MIYEQAIAKVLRTRGNFHEFDVLQSVIAPEIIVHLIAESIGCTLRDAEDVFGKSTHVGEYNHVVVEDASQDVVVSVEKHVKKKLKGPAFTKVAVQEELTVDLTGMGFWFWIERGVSKTELEE